MAALLSQGIVQLQKKRYLELNKGRNETKTLFETKMSERM